MQLSNCNTFTSAVHQTGVDGRTEESFVTSDNEDDDGGYYENSETMGFHEATPELVLPHEVEQR